MIRLNFKCPNCGIEHETREELIEIDYYSDFKRKGMYSFSTNSIIVCKCGVWITFESTTDSGDKNVSNNILVERR